MASQLNAGLSKKIAGIRVWELIGIIVGALLVIILFILFYLCLNSRKKSKGANNRLPISHIPPVSKEIREIRVDRAAQNGYECYQDGNSYSLQDKVGEKDSDRLLVNPSVVKIKEEDNGSRSGFSTHIQKEEAGSHSGDEGVHITASSPLSGLPEFSHLGWGHWFTLRDLEIATDRFSNQNIIGEGGYGIVYRGKLINGAQVAIKRLLNNL